MRCFVATQTWGMVLIALAVVGCASSNQWVTVRDTPRNPLASSLNLLSRHGPKPTERTMQLLRRQDLVDDLKGDRAELLAKLDELHQREPSREHQHAAAELAYIEAKRVETTNEARALEFYGAALIHAYRYLFDDAENLATNPYDPQFRGATDLYNQSLESMLRIVRKRDALKPGLPQTIQTANHECRFDIEVHSTGWHDEDLADIEFVNDYQVQGLRNHYHTYGIGVPLIALRKRHPSESPSEKYYPSQLSFPVTAFLRVQDEVPLDGRTETDDAAAESPAPHFVLELHDSLDRRWIQVAHQRVPLEADLSTPLAYLLNQPELRDADIGTAGLLMPDKVKPLQGLYMLEPFETNKMPVVMVHGLWSSPITWMEMFNDLRSDPLVRQHYQFWFYLYPTGQPFWNSAAQMREDVAQMRAELDPQRQHPALDQMVLIGHSMGGLVSKLQSVDSDDQFWQTMSERSFDELDVDEDLREELAATYFFQPNSSVKRVVTIGTPHRGSNFANSTTRWLAEKLITLPQKMLLAHRQLLARNSNYFRSGAPLDVKTSIDSLAPDSPLLPVLLTAKPGPWVSYHNIVGHIPQSGWRGYFAGEGDGVVPLESARLDDMQQLQSQIIVDAEHTVVHRHPQSILEVRRILFQQLAELQAYPTDIQIATGDSRAVNHAQHTSPLPTAMSLPRPLPPVDDPQRSEVPAIAP